MRHRSADSLFKDFPRQLARYYKQNNTDQISPQDGSALNGRSIQEKPIYNQPAQARVSEKKSQKLPAEEHAHGEIVIKRKIATSSLPLNRWDKSAWSEKADRRVQFLSLF